MRRALIAAGLMLVAASIVGVARATRQPPPAPAPEDDRVGFPEGYATDYARLYVFDRPDNKQVRVIYGNEAAAAARLGEPFPYGSVLVMETYRAKLDGDGSPLLDEAGRYQRDQITGIFVMRKEAGFGAAYEQNRTGEWEYVAYRPDGTYLTPPRNTASCAICHGDTRGANDWTFRTTLYFNRASGAVPTAVMLNYTFLPAAITVRQGATVTWYNDDSLAHTVSSVSAGLDSGRMLQGASFRFTFTTAGEFDYQCDLHPAMTGRVIVTE